MSDRPPRPALIPFDPVGVPGELTCLPQWVGWRLEWREGEKGEPGKWTKVPKNPRTGRNASPTNPNDWGTLAEVVAGIIRFGFDGGGFVFTAGDPYAGIDVDKCRDPETGKFDALGGAIGRRFASYSEPSPSGTGMHVIVKAVVPPGGNRTGRVEAYDRDRYFAFTGQPFAGLETIADCGDELATWHAETFAKPAPERPAYTAPPLSIDDAELLRRCRGNDKFRRLWDGDDAEYDGDTSRADLAFCNIVVRNGGGRAQADGLYRRSGRARAKWDERRGDRTYGDMTLDEAFDGTVIPFSPGPRLAVGSRPTDAGGPNPQDADDLPDDVEGLKAIVIDLRERIVAAEQRAQAAEWRASSAEGRADKLAALQSRTTGILRNNKLGQERFTAVALAYQLGNKESAGDAGENGLYPIPLARIAESAGVSEDTASKHVKKLAGEGVLRREVRWVNEEWADPATGELHRGRNRLFIGPRTNVTDFVEAVARLEPAKPKPQWGGRPDRCPHHPTADVIKTTAWHCAKCGKELHRETETIRPNPQDAGLVDEPLAATGTDAATAPSYPPRGSTSTRPRSGAVCHNDERRMEPAEIDRQAWEAWQRGASPPPDRRPDGVIGGPP